MKKNEVYGYIRVSDTKQIDGASLSAQQKAIMEYALKNSLTITKWFEETKTAAKRGRPKFTEMLSLLKSGKANGVVIHKIDRSARNLHDWASVADLIDNGIQVHFAHESLDMTERGGRLSADIQAVMASDYVRNLRQETIKGIYGRLSKGLYPFNAPVGYLNMGKGAVKLKDPDKYKLIQELFKLYASASFNSTDLSNLMFKKGLRNHNGNKINKNSLLRILKNPFYIGLMQVKGKMFKGIHEPIIEKRVFNKVQDVLSGRIQHKGVIHDFTFRKRIKCKECNYMITAEKQKGIIYYRCPTKECITKSKREDYIVRSIRQKLNYLLFNEEELHKLEEIIQELDMFNNRNTNVLKKQINLQIGTLKKKEDKLLEAYLENVIENESFQRKRNSLVEEIHNLEQKKQQIDNPKQTAKAKIENFFELIKTLIKPYDLANKSQKRIYLDLVTSNFTISGKNLYFTTVSPFTELLNLANSSKCSLTQDSHRKIYPKIHQLDKNEIVLVHNTSLVPRPTLSKEQLRQWCDEIDRKFDYVPTLDEILYPNYQINSA